MRRLAPLVVPLALFLLLLVSCGGPGPERSAGSSGDEEAGSAGGSGSAAGERVSAEGGSYTRISPAGLDAMLGDGDGADVVLVNTHVPYDGDIPGTDLSIPYDEVGRNLDRLPRGEDVRLVLYCKSGRMSEEAAETLVRLGYTNVWDLEGGMDAWQRAGRPLERS